LLKPLKRMAASVIAITGNKASTLGQQSDATIVYGAVAESLFNLAPSTSAVVAMSIGHALALALCNRREFTDAEFARYHPAGSLGFKLSSVDDHMRRGSELRIARASDSVREVFAKARHKGRRTGAVMLVDGDGKLTGLFTDSDLARLFERRADDCFDGPVSAVMTKTPLTVRHNARMVEAIALMRERKISELPVIDEENRPIGLLDITDLIGAEAQKEQPGQEPPAVRMWNRASA
jgi:arabinose-5-phosphate isomerase